MSFSPVEETEISEKRVLENDAATKTNNEPEEKKRKVVYDPVTAELTIKQHRISFGEQFKPPISFKPALARALVDARFEHASELQLACLPAALQGFDIISWGNAGTGKTTIFILVSLQRMQVVKDEVVCLVLAHTRELVHQINRQYELFAKYMEGVKTASFYGGVPIEENLHALQHSTPNIVVGTPNRIQDLVSRKSLRLNHVQFFIVDECDHVLSIAVPPHIKMGENLQEIISACPSKEKMQIIFVSCSIPLALLPVCRSLTKADHTFEYNYWLRAKASS